MLGIPGFEKSLFELLCERGSLVGYEGEADKGGEEKKEEPDDDSDDESEEEPAGEEDKKKDPSGLQSALRKERLERKRLAKELKDLKKFKEEVEGKDASESDKANKKATKLEQTNAKLATKLRTQAVEMAITKYAGEFQDAEDAVMRLRDQVNADQDEDDPSEIEIDFDEVQRLVKKLAKDKPYLLRQKEGEEEELEPSGSRFAGKGKSNQELDDEKLRQKYSSLRRPANTT